MELAPTPDALIRPWRKATVVATTVAVVELILLVAAGIALLGRHLAHSAKPATPVPKRSTPAPHRAAVLRARPTPIGAPHLARSATAVVVLNANGRPGAAASEASIVSARGYRIGRVGNAPTSSVAQSVVMYRPGYRAEGARLAHDLGIELFAPLDGLTQASLGHAQLAVLVGRA